MNLIQIYKKVRKYFDRSRPLVEVSVSRENLLHNLHTYQQEFPALTFAPVIKSNAYGHGLIEVAEILEQEHIAFLAVDSIFEAKRLRHAGIRSRILVLDYVRPEEIAASSLRNVEFTIVDLEQLRTLATLLKKSKRLHLKVDTGMHRQGIQHSHLQEALGLIESNPNIRIVGVSTHLAAGDDEHHLLAEKQIAAWKDAVSLIGRKIVGIEYLHIAATSAIPLKDAIPANVARLGIGLYGIDPAGRLSSKLRPVLEIRTIITSLREIPIGDSVGYDGTFVAKRTSRIATIPLGYSEGVNRQLSNKGSVLINGKPAPIAGRVSMNMTGLDVTDIPNIKVGDEVVVISRDPEAANSIEKIGRLIDRIGYELLVRIPAHLRRVVE